MKYLNYEEVNGNQDKAADEESQIADESDDKDSGRRKGNSDSGRQRSRSGSYNNQRRGSRGEDGYERRYVHSSEGGRPVDRRSGEVYVQNPDAQQGAIRGAGGEAHELRSVRGSGRRI